MSIRKLLVLIGITLILGVWGFQVIQNHIHETVLYPPEILGKPFLAFSYEPGRLSKGSEVIRFHPTKPEFHVLMEHGSRTLSYDFSFHPHGETKSLDDSQQSIGDSETKLNYLRPGRYLFGYGAQEGYWQYGGEIADVPNQNLPHADYGPFFRNRTVIDYRSEPSIGMKDWSITFEGKWRNETGAFATGDNLFGTTEKHRLQLAFFTGSWTLLVRGQPIFRQRVKSLPVGADFYYSPVYGVVVFDYQEPGGNGTVYVIKTPASGTDIYKDLKAETTIVGNAPQIRH